MKALFAGSFDPFTVGHKDIIDRALPLFDEIVVGVGYNISKQYTCSAEETAETIGNIYAHEPKVTVNVYSGLTVDFAKELSADCILRAIRSVKDFEYEQEIGRAHV